MRFVSFYDAIFLMFIQHNNISKLHYTTQNRLMWQNFIAVLPRLAPSSGLNSYFCSSYKFIVWSEPHLCIYVFFFSRCNVVFIIIIIILKIVTFIMIIIPFLLLSNFSIFEQDYFFSHSLHLLCVYTYILEKKYTRFKDKTRMHNAIGNGDGMEKE